MDAIEKAIRGAFERGDPADRSFREKVYRSAFAALERSIQANPNVTGAVAEHRRRAMSSRITEIESEFIPAVQAEPDRRPEPVGQASPATSPEPALDAPAPSDLPRRERTVDTDDFAADRDDRYSRTDEDTALQRPRRGRFWSVMFIGVTLVSAIAIALWFWLGSGIFSAPGEGRGAVPNPPLVLEEEDFSPDDAEALPPRIPGQGDGLEGWIVVFDPSDPTSVIAPADASAEEIEDDGARYLRIRSGASGAAILFDVGQGVLERVAGGRAVFNIMARAQEGEETQISVDCNFGELGDCGRKRYLVGLTREEFLFEVDLPNIRPGSSGTIAINSDIQGTGRSVDIFAIRVSPSQ